MKTQFHILVATDYSDVAANAERYAINLAKDTHSALTFLHVFDKSETFPKEFTELEHVDYTPLDYETSRLEQHIAELFQAMKINAGEVEYRCMVRKGDICEEINTEQYVSAPDFVILGTHLESGLKKLFFAGHTWQTINKLNIPVLAVPAETSYSPVQSIVYATNYDKSELPVINFLASMADKFNAKLTVLHVTNDVFSAEFEKDLFNRFVLEVKAEIEYSNLELRLVHDAKLADGLNGYCVRNKSNWLVMSPQKTPLLENIFMPVASATKQMSFSTHVPLFAIPGNAHSNITRQEKEAR